jgi:hypothetical protein
MSQFGAGLAYLGAILLYVLLATVYVPLLMLLGIPAQVALTVTGIGTLCLIALSIGTVTGLL